jgi:hypothetical protein
MEPLEALVMVEILMGEELLLRVFFHHDSSWFQVLLPSEAGLAVRSNQKFPSYFVQGFVRGPILNIYEMIILADCRDRTSFSKFAKVLVNRVPQMLLERRLLMCHEPRVPRSAGNLSNVRTTPDGPYVHPTVL